MVVMRLMGAWPVHEPTGSSNSTRLHRYGKQVAARSLSTAFVLHVFALLSSTMHPPIGGPVHAFLTR